MKPSFLCVAVVVAGCAGSSRVLRPDTGTTGGVLEAATAPLAVPLPHGWKLARAGEPRKALVPSASESCKSFVWFDYVWAVSVDYARKLIDTESLGVRTLPTWAERQYTDVRLGGRHAVQLRRVPVQPDRSPYHVRESSIYLVEAAGGVLLVHVLSESYHPLACLPLHERPAAELAAAFFAPSVLEQAEHLSRRLRPPPLREARPVPRTLEESLVFLENGLTAEDVETLRSTGEHDLGRYHFGIGIWIRNNWGLLEESPLARTFEQMGVYEPDAMSEMILRSFWQRLNGLPLTIERDAAAVKRHAELSQAPEPRRCDDGSAAVHLFGLTGGEPGRGRYVHAFACDADGTYWVWELDRGWYRPDSPLVERIIELREQGGIVEAPIEKRHARPRHTDS